MSEAYGHLHASIRSVADDSAELRIRRIRTDRWVSYARAESALAAMEDLLNFPKRTRMPNLLLVGPTNNGKTMIVEKFRRAHPSTPASQTESGAAHVPVLRVQMPAGPDEPRFFGAVLDELGYPHMLTDRITKLSLIHIFCLFCATYSGFTLYRWRAILIWLSSQLGLGWRARRRRGRTAPLPR